MREEGRPRACPPMGRNIFCSAPCWHTATAFRHWATVFIQRSPQSSGFCWHVKQLALKLAQKGYVLFRRDAADARRTRVLPGPACAALRENYLQKQQAFIHALFAGVPQKDIKAALDVIAKLDENMRAMQEGEI